MSTYERSLLKLAPPVATLERLLLQTASAAVNGGCREGDGGERGAQPHAPQANKAASMVFGLSLCLC